MSDKQNDMDFYTTMREKNDDSNAKNIKEGDDLISILQNDKLTVIEKLQKFTKSTILENQVVNADEIDCAAKIRSINLDYVDMYAKNLESNTNFMNRVPLLACFYKGKYYMIDGNHRVKAYQKYLKTNNKDKKKQITIDYVIVNDVDLAMAMTLSTITEQPYYKSFTWVQIVSSCLILMKGGKFLDIANIKDEGDKDKAVFETLSSILKSDSIPKNIRRFKIISDEDWEMIKNLYNSQNNGNPFSSNKRLWLMFIPHYEINPEESMAVLLALKNFNPNTHNPFANIKVTIQKRLESMHCWIENKDLDYHLREILAKKEDEEITEAEKGTVRTWLLNNENSKHYLTKSNQQKHTPQEHFQKLVNHYKTRGRRSTKLIEQKTSEKMEIDVSSGPPKTAITKIVKKGPKVFKNKNDSKEEKVHNSEKEKCVSNTCLLCDGDSEIINLYNDCIENDRTDCAAGMFYLLKKAKHKQCSFLERNCPGVSDEYISKNGSFRMHSKENLSRTDINADVHMVDDPGNESTYVMQYKNFENLTLNSQNATEESMDPTKSKRVHDKGNGNTKSPDKKKMRKNRGSYESDEDERQ